MKKKFFMMLAMTTIAAVGAHADSHWTLAHQGEGASTETMIYAKLDLGEPASPPSYENYEVAAFIGDEVRAVATCSTNPAAGNKNYFTLRVEGGYGISDADNGKAITFKMYNTVTEVEYNLTNSAITFDGGRHGELTNLFALSCVEAEMVRLGDITMNKGETINLMDRLELYPENATTPNGITWSLGPGADAYLSLTPEGMLTANAVGSYLEVNYSCGTLGKSGYVTVVNLATAIKVNSGYETIMVNVGDKDVLNTKLGEAVTLTPSDATDLIHWVSSNEEIVTEDMTDGRWNPIAKGTVTMTAQVWDDLGAPRLQANITVKVTEPLTGFTIDIPNPMRAGTTEQIIVTPVPNDVELDLQYLTSSITDSSLPEGWTLTEVATTSINNSGQVVFTMDVDNPGTGNFRVSYDDGVTSINSDPQPLNIGVPLALDEGWQWKTIWQDVPTGDMLTAFTSDLVEIRSQNGVMANDGTYGYFGTLYDNGLMADVAYKINMNADVLARNAYVMQGGSYLARDKEQSLLKGWTWIAYPYYHEYDVTDINIAGTTGDRIVSFNEGFVEYDGTNWSGSLVTLVPYQAYMYYNASDAASSFTWENEPAFHSAHSNSGPMPAPRRAYREHNSVWQYDATHYRDNMSIIAILNDEDVDKNLSVGAFVGDECRGEGRVVNGKLFITVHADQGEQISFKLHDEYSGLYSDINEKVSMSLMLGSLAKPFKMTAAMPVSTGISQASVEGREPRAEGRGCEYHDLSGRRVSTTHRGIVLRRLADGSVHKVVVK